MGASSQVSVLPDSIVSGHAPVVLLLPGPLELDLGFSARRPRLVVVDPEYPLTLHAAQQRALQAAQETASAEAYWTQWNSVAEQCLVSLVPNPVSFKGRGNGLSLQANSPSAPQSSQGCAVTAAIIALRRRLTGLRRIRMYRTQGTHNRHQVRELRTLLRKFPAPDDLFALEAQLLALEAQLATHRRESWTGWCREQWAAHPGKLYRYIKGGCGFSNTQLHHGDRGAPSSLQGRFSALVSH